MNIGYSILPPDDLRLTLQAIQMQREMLYDVLRPFSHEHLDLNYAMLEEIRRHGDPFYVGQEPTVESNESERPAPTPDTGGSKSFLPKPPIEPRPSRPLAPAKPPTSQSPVLMFFDSNRRELWLEGAKTVRLRPTGTRMFKLLRDFQWQDRKAGRSPEDYRYFPPGPLSQELELPSDDALRKHKQHLQKALRAIDQYRPDLVGVDIIESVRKTGLRINPRFLVCACPENPD